MNPATLKSRKHNPRRDDAGSLGELIEKTAAGNRARLKESRAAAIAAVRTILANLAADPLPDGIDDRIAKALDDVLAAKSSTGQSPNRVEEDSAQNHSGRRTAADHPASDGKHFTPDEGENRMTSTVTANDVLRLAAHDDEVRIKRPSERYSTTKSVGRHARTGQPVRYQGRDVELLSQMETAKAGAFFKYLGSRSGINVNLTEHERSLLEEMIQKDSWCGKVGTEWQTGIQGDRVKALLNDATSGGREIAPEWFDDALVSYPLLHSEILPEVDLRDVPRSNSVEGAAVGNPSVTWGTAEGTAISLFNTNNLVSELNTAIHPVAVAIEVGNDFLSDAAVNVGDMLLTNIGQRMLQELDRVIVAGNGTSEPQGIVNASGIVDITAENPTTGPLTYDDALNLSFGIAKQYRAPGYRPGFIMTDTTYKRFLAIATGVTGDKRPLFGMNVKSYELVEYPVRIEQTGLDNNQILFGALKKYRLYRRHGVESRFTSEGQTLTLKNTSLLYVRGRFGGRVMDANAFAMTDGAPE
ncbi:MAG: phage major capsid protein [Planctomycetaceae bacterium]